MFLTNWRLYTIPIALTNFIEESVTEYNLVMAASASALLPVFTYIFRAFAEHQSGGVVWFCTLMAVLIAAILIIKHIPNIKRIAAGTESKLSFGDKK